MEDGYGIHKGMIQDCQGEGVRLILTCDNGIREFEAAAYAREVGLDLVITDHHEITPDENGADVLPAADAILNPHRQDCAYPYKQLCGAGVAFKLMEALYERQKQDKRQLENLLDWRRWRHLRCMPAAGEKPSDRLSRIGTAQHQPNHWDSRAHAAR